MEKRRSLELSSELDERRQQAQAVVELREELDVERRRSSDLAAANRELQTQLAAQDERARYRSDQRAEAQRLFDDLQAQQALVLEKESQFVRAVDDMNRIRNELGHTQQSLEAERIRSEDLRTQLSELRMSDESLTRRFDECTRLLNLAQTDQQQAERTCVRLEDEAANYRDELELAQASVRRLEARYSESNQQRSIEVDKALQLERQVSAISLDRSQSLSPPGYSLLAY